MSQLSIRATPDVAQPPDLMVLCSRSFAILAAISMNSHY
jgi:hypothetical protein